MHHLRLSASEYESEPIGRRLEGIDGVSRVLSAPSPGEPVVVLSADVEPDGIGALQVLAINVALLIVSGTGSLAAQRFAASRSPQPT